MQLSKDVKFGHPKYYKLHDILVSHFRQSDDHSRVIVFFEYRESVIEAHALLLHTKPLIRPKIFLGQKLGVTQRTQINVKKNICFVLFYDIYFLRLSKRFVKAPVTRYYPLVLVKRD